MKLGLINQGNGWRAFQRVHQGPGGLHSKRFPKTATTREMVAWQEGERVAYRAQTQQRATVVRGTLAADIAAYLKLVPTMASFDDRERDLRAWEAVLGMRPRHKLTRDDYRLVLQDWRLAGGRDGKPLAASTVNHRRTALLHLYTTLDGKGAPNPLREIRPFVEPPPEPRDLGLATVRAIIGKLRPSKTRARLLALAWTGIRGRSEFAKIKPEHVDLERGICWVPTGKKGRPRELVLNEEGIAAWRQVAKFRAWGDYSKDGLRHAFQRAVAKVNIDRAKLELPPLERVRPYDLRHTIATALRKAGADLADVQAFLGHTSQRMTQRYAPYESEKLRRAISDIGTAPPVDPEPPARKPKRKRRG